MTVAHEGGDRLTDDNTGELTVVSDEGSIDQDWPRPVERGDTLRVTGSVVPGEAVRVAWVGDENESTATLGRDVAPENASTPGAA